MEEYIKISDKALSLIRDTGGKVVEGIGEDVGTYTCELRLPQHSRLFSYISASYGDTPELITYPEYEKRITHIN